jgi:hypothetical protein
MISIGLAIMALGIIIFKGGINLYNKKQALYMYKIENKNGKIEVITKNNKVVGYNLKNGFIRKPHKGEDINDYIAKIGQANLSQV